MKMTKSPNFRTPLALDLMRRTDFQRLAERIYLPISEARHGCLFGLGRSSESCGFRRPGQARARGHCVRGGEKLSADFPGAPVVNHLLIVYDTRIDFFRSVDIAPESLHASDTNPWGRLLPLLESVGERVSTPFSLLCSDEREEGLEGMQVSLLSRSGLIQKAASVESQ